MCHSAHRHGPSDMGLVLGPNVPRHLRNDLPTRDFLLDTELRRNVRTIAGMKMFRHPTQLDGSSQNLERRVQILGLMDWMGTGFDFD